MRALFVLRPHLVVPEINTLEPKIVSSERMNFRTKLTRPHEYLVMGLCRVLSADRPGPVARASWACRCMH